MTPQQLATSRAYIDTVPAWAALPNNSESAPAFYVYKTSLPTDEVMDAINWANLTPNTGVADADLSTQAVSLQRLVRELRCQGKQFNLQTMLVGRERINPSRPNTRAGLQDALTDLPSGANGNLRQGGWAAVSALLYRPATLGEQVLSTGAGTTVAPATMGFEGAITFADVQSARSL